MVAQETARSLTMTAQSFHYARSISVILLVTHNLYNKTASINIQNSNSNHDIIDGGERGFINLRCRAGMDKSRAPGSPGHSIFYGGANICGSEGRHLIDATLFWRLEF
jgi:hypothetical protein